MHVKPYEASVASNGRQAMEFAMAERPDVVLPDIMIPGMDGIEVCRRTKAGEQLRKIPVILVTAKAFGENAVRGLDAGADDYLTKLFNRAVRAARLRSIIRLKQELRNGNAHERGTAARGEASYPVGIRPSCEQASGAGLHHLDSLRPRKERPPARFGLHVVRREDGDAHPPGWTTE